MIQRFLILSALLLLVGGCVHNEKDSVTKTVVVEKEITETQVDPYQIEEITFKKAVRRKIDVTRKDDSIVSFKPEGFTTENKAVYDIDVKLDNEGTFSVTSTIEAENLSKDSWEDIIFYFIPNTFTEKWKPEFLKDTAQVEVNEVAFNGEKADYKLVNDTLQVLLETPLAPKQKANVSVQYEFQLPEEGFRFSQFQGNYYLAQWYPMLATYRSGWDKDDYILGGETFHTGFSDFTVTYEIPEGYLMISSADQEAFDSPQKGTIEIENKKEFFPIVLGPRGTFKLKNSKEIFLAITKNMITRSAVVDGIEVRVFAFQNNEQYIDTALDLSVDSLQYFNQNLGGYPYKQLDVIMDQSGMEYPGIVTVAGEGIAEHTIVHEIAHQWFYGLITNNSFKEAWIDEALTDFSTHLYFLDRKGQSEMTVFKIAKDRIQQDKHNNKLKLANLPLPEYKDGGFSSANYKVPSMKLWEISGRDAKTSLSFLKTYVDTYAYKQVDAHEWFRFTQTFFQIEDPTILTEWIKVD